MLGVDLSRESAPSDLDTCHALRRWSVRATRRWCHCAWLSVCSDAARSATPHITHTPGEDVNNEPAIHISLHLHPTNESPLQSPSDPTSHPRNGHVIGGLSKLNKQMSHNSRTNYCEAKSENPSPLIRFHSYYSVFTHIHTSITPFTLYPCQLLARREFHTTSINIKSDTNVPHLFP